MKPTITVVVPVLNEERNLQQTLESLRNQTFKEYELIVVDNGSTDKSPEIAKRYAHRVLFEPMLGPDVARHRGFMEAKTELLASADADSVYPPNWLHNLVSALTQPGVVAVFGPLAFKESSPRAQKLQLWGYELLARLAPLIGVYPAGASSFGCHRTGYLAVGGYPPIAHLANADFRLAKRLARVGKVRFCRGMACYTSHRTYQTLGFWKSLCLTLRIWIDIALARDRMSRADYHALRAINYSRPNPSNRSTRPGENGQDKGPANSTPWENGPLAARPGGVGAWGKLTRIMQNLTKDLQIRNLLIFPLLEFVWLFYLLFALLLTTLVRTKRIGSKPPRPCVLAVMHVGGFEPLFVTRASGHWRGWALYTMDWPSPVVRFLCRAFWRFGVTQDPARKTVSNPRTLEKAVVYLQKGGSLMVFPEGDKFWERRLYPGVARLAKRAGVPLIPVGLENALLGEPGDERLSIWRGFSRALRKTLKKRWIAVHFAAPIRPDPTLSEEEDVDRMMQELAQVLRTFYQKFYGLPGSVWVKPERSRRTS